MAYKLLGMLVWKLGKLFLRRKYGSPPTKPLIAGGVIVLAVGLLLVLLGRRDSLHA